MDDVEYWLGEEVYMLEVFDCHFVLDYYDDVFTEAVQSYLDITCPPTIRFVPTS